MQRMLNAIVGTLVVASLAGCASVSAVPFQADVKQSIKRIAIIKTPEPERYVMNPGQSPAGAALYMFGAIGGAILGGIEAGRMEAATKSFNEAITAFNPSVNSTFQVQLEAGLKARGYDVALVPMPPKDADGKNFDFAKVDGNFDAFLVGILNGGYSVDAGAASPRLTAEVKVMGKSSDQPYFAQTYVYGTHQIYNSIGIEPETRFTVDPPEAVYKNGKLAAEGLQVGAFKIADRVTIEF